MDTVRFTLRIPTNISKWLTEQALNHNRSKTQEIISILKLAKARSEAMGDARDEKWLAMKGDKDVSNNQ